MLSAAVTVGTVTIDSFDVVYQFQLSASVYIGTTENEGQLSDITSRSTVYIPQPGKSTPWPNIGGGERGGWGGVVFRISYGREGDLSTHLQYEGGIIAFHLLDIAGSCHCIVL